MQLKSNALADDLQRVLDGVVALDDVLDNKAHAGEPLDSCFHGLQHFLMDDDIRASDAAYREMQEGEMQKLIGLLRTGANGATLSKVHFLGHSKVSI